LAVVLWKLHLARKFFTQKVHLIFYPKQHTGFSFIRLMPTQYHQRLALFKRGLPVAVVFV
jgi:hypothetical protein